MCKNIILLFPELFFLVLEDMLYFLRLLKLNDKAAVMLTLNFCSFKLAVNA